MGDYKRINAVMEDSSSTLSSKKQRVGESTQSLELSMTTMPIHDLGDFRLSLNSPTEFDGIVNLVGDTCSSFCFHSESPVSCCSSNESSDFLKDGLQIVDLEDKTSETLNPSSIKNSYFSSFCRETTLSNEMYGQDSEVMEPPAASHMRRLPEAKFPPRDEIEEFFATAEKYQKNRFAEKYNFDIVNDMPLEGRYQWVRLKP